MKKAVLISILFMIFFSLICCVGRADSVTEYMFSGFYKFPDSVEINPGSGKTVNGEFYHKFRSGLSKVVFKVSGVDPAWCRVEPTNVDFIPPKEFTPVSLIFSIPDYAEGGDYKVVLSVESENVRELYTANITLKVNTTSTTTTIETTTTLATTTTEKTVPTGRFPLNKIMVDYWYIIVIVIVIILVWLFYPKEERITEPTYVKMKPEEAKEALKPAEKVEMITTEPTFKDRLEMSRKRMAEEMRQRALEMDKKLKGK